MTAKRNAHRDNRVVTAFVKIPEPLEPGKVRCAGCGKVVRLTRNGKIYGHHSPAGEPCAYKASYRTVRLEQLPPVVMPRKRGAKAKPAVKRDPAEPSRLDVGSHCKECGVWLPGERSLCGTCYATKRR